MKTAQEIEVEYQKYIEEDALRAEREERDERIKNNYELQRIWDLGKACKQFWQGDVGRFVLDKATADAEAAKNDLAAIKRTKYANSYEFEAAVAELQQRAFIPALVWTWLNEAIRAADEADQLLTEKEEENEY